MTPFYHAGQTVEIAYEDDIDFSAAVCSIEIEQYVGPLNLPAGITTIPDSMIHRAEGKVFYRSTFLPGFYRYWMTVEKYGTIGKVEGRFHVG